jgi:threonine synthase
VIEAVSDLDILRAQRDLAVRDGVFVEPASAAGVAGLLMRSSTGGVAPGQTISVTVTGHGLKDVETPLRFRDVSVDLVIDADADQAAAAADLIDG